MSSPFVLVVAIILFIILARAAWNIHIKAGAGVAKLDQAETELAKLQARQSDLSNQVSYLSSENGVEAELRSKYRGVKEGESVAVIVDDQSNTQAAAVSNASDTPPIGWWQRFLRFFGL